MTNEIHFVGLLKEISISAYTNKDQQTHNQVEFRLESDERIPQSLKLKVKGSIGDQLANLEPQPGLCSMVAYIEFHTFYYNEKLCQEIRVWKLEVTMHATGQTFVITSNNSNHQN